MTTSDERAVPSPGRRRLGLVLVGLGLASLLAGTASLAAQYTGGHSVDGHPVARAGSSIAPHPGWTTLINPDSGLSYQIPPTGWRPQDTAGDLGQVQLGHGAYNNPYTCGNPAQGYQRSALGSGSAPKADPTVLATSLARIAATNYYTPAGGGPAPTVTVGGPELVQRTTADGRTVTGAQVEAIADTSGDPCLASEGEVIVLVLALAQRDAVLVVNGDTRGGPANPPPTTAEALQEILDTARPAS